MKDIFKLSSEKMTSEPRVIRVGSRKSQLALIQTNNVIDQLNKIHKNVKFEVVTMSTTGDNILDRALSKIGEKNLFTRELEEALLDHRVDFVVHSLKDLPTVLPPGLAIGAVCKRDDTRDAIVLHPKHRELTSIDQLPKGSILGTSSLRRGAQLRRQHPYFQLKDVRGNLNTRLRKLTDSDDYDALVLAVAGLERMEWHDKVSVRLDPSEFMYAVGQGAMAVECRADDAAMLSFFTDISDYSSLVPCIAERAFLKTLEGGCSVPVSVYCNLEKGETTDRLTLKGAVFSIDGSQGVIESETVELDITDEPGEKGPRLDSPQMYSAIIANHVSPKALKAAEDLGIALAERVMAKGADKILIEAKRQIANEMIQENEQRLKAAAEKNGVKNKLSNGKTVPVS